MSSKPTTPPKALICLWYEKDAEVATRDQEETDRYWNAIVGNGGEESQCGWRRDRWGVSWQITPKVLIETVSGPDRAAATRVFEAMMKMRKIDVAALERAKRGE